MDDFLLLHADLFAIPDFAAGAMENWGLITYRETALLYDNETNPATSKQRVAVVIAHELAHQVREHDTMYADGNSTDINRSTVYVYMYNDNYSLHVQASNSQNGIYSSAEVLDTQIQVLAF